MSATWKSTTGAARFIHGRERDAEDIVTDIERRVTDETGDDLPAVDETITVLFASAGASSA